MKFQHLNANPKGLDVTEQFCFKVHKNKKKRGGGDGKMEFEKFAFLFVIEICLLIAL